DDMSFDGISNLMEQCNRCIDNGDIEEAKRLYSHILSIYESIKNGRDYPRISDTYNKIKRIYYRLQIYR
ncbi:MAG: tetratricopeptide repeat protein, partial [Candidatus Aenigmatarchaeota archaeon]